MTMVNRNVMIDKSFILKQVDPLKVANDMIYNRLRAPLTKIKYVANAATQDIQIGHNYESEAFELIGHEGNKIRIITTNQQMYEAYKQGIQQIQFKCLWCHLNYNQIPLVIPTLIEKNIITHEWNIHGSKKFCSFECMLAYVKRKNNSNFYNRDPLYTDSEVMVNFSGTLMHGRDYIIEPALDWELLDSNGGPLSYKDWSSKYHSYVYMPNVIQIPTKFEYFVISR